MNLGHWKTKLDVPDSFYGFIYIIRNIATGRAYIGRKQTVFAVTKKPLKGNKNKRHSTIESDWRTYCGSCKKLNQDINEIGLDYFTFEIIRFCNSKSELAYHEVSYILQSNAILGTDFYNEYLLVRLRNPKK